MKWTTRKFPGVIAAAIVLTFAALALRTSSSVTPAGSFTTDNLTVTTTSTLSSATVSTLCSFNASKQLVSYAGSGCGAGSAISSLSSNGVPTCVALPVASTPSSPWFQDGIDGSITFDGSTTILGIVPASNTYTLTRSIYPSAMTVNNGVTIKVVGFPIVVSGTLTDNGTIHADGGAGTTGGAGAAVPAGFFGASSAGGSSAGGVGATSGRVLPVPWQATAAGCCGSGISGAPGTTPTAIGAGGGGGGGTGGGGGGNGGGVTVALSTQTAPLFDILRTGFTGYVTSNLLTWGAGGGGGTNSTSSGTGGGGGGGGSIVYIAAKTITGTGTFRAAGGVGGPATSNAGGGGGGGGGIVVLLYSTRSGSTTSTAPGGVHGAGNGTGGNGGDGHAGLVFAFNLSGDGT